MHVTMYMVFQNGKCICRFYLTSIALYSEMSAKKVSSCVQS